MVLEATLHGARAVSYMYVVVTLVISTIGLQHTDSELRIAPSPVNILIECTSVHKHPQMLRSFIHVAFSHASPSWYLSLRSCKTDGLCLTEASCELQHRQPIKWPLVCLNYSIINVGFDPSRVIISLTEHNSTYIKRVPVFNSSWFCVIFPFGLNAALWGACTMSKLFFWLIVNPRFK